MFFSNSAFKVGEDSRFPAHRLDIDWVRVILCSALWVILLFLQVNILNIYRATHQRVHHAGIVATIIEIVFCSAA
jgi:hypothetical protein